MTSTATAATAAQPAAITALDVWTASLPSRAFSMALIKLCIANDSVKWAKGPPPEMFFPQTASKIPAAVLASLRYSVCAKQMTIDTLATTDSLGMYFPANILAQSVTCTGYSVPAAPPNLGNYTAAVDQYGNSAILV